MEATPHIDFTLSAIREGGAKAGLVVCPGTPPDHFAQADDLDLALIMTVNPGWGGQPFLRNQLDKIRKVREMLGPDVAIEVDGGVNPETGKECADAGATWLSRARRSSRRRTPWPPTTRSRRPSAPSKGRGQMSD